AATPRRLERQLGVFLSSSILLFIEDASLFHNLTICTEARVWAGFANPSSKSETSFKKIGKGCDGGGVSSQWRERLRYQKRRGEPSGRGSPQTRGRGRWRGRCFNIKSAYSSVSLTC